MFKTSKGGSMKASAKTRLWDWLIGQKNEGK